MKKKEFVTALVLQQLSFGTSSTRGDEFAECAVDTLKRAKLIADALDKSDAEFFDGEEPDDLLG